LLAGASLPSRGNPRAVGIVTGTPCSHPVLAVEPLTNWFEPPLAA
jgi:hypothetical protein